jgi:ADP-heptose:LPS heptosyltransferase
LYKIINKKKLFATITADVIGNFLFWPVNRFKNIETIIPENIKEILVVRTAYLGDVVMTLPILKPLKERFSDSRVTFLTSSPAKEVLLNNPYIDNIITYDPFWFYPVSKNKYLKFLSQIKKKKFDLIIEARGDIREILFLVSPAAAKYKISYDVGGGGFLLTHVVPYNGLKHKVEYHLDLARYLGCSTDNIEWGVYLNNDEERRIREILKENDVNKPFISVHPGSRLPLKQWPVEKCAILYDRIIDNYGISLVIFGAKHEKGLVDNIVKRMKYKPIVLAGRLSLRELAGILSETALFVCNDSVPMHIATAMKTPTVAIFGPSKSRETGPYDNRCRVVEKDFPCRFSCDESECKHKVHNECMKSVTVEEVFDTVKELMG